MKKNISQRIVGIDLDNTIISYDKAFRNGAIVKGLTEKNCNLNKKALRDLIRAKPNGEFEWQKLQGYVYGAGINQAEIFPGLIRFLWRCRQRKILIEIVSHKTEFGHFDRKKISLRDSATNFLKSNGLLDKKNPLIAKVTYKSSKKEKLNYINHNDYEYFIDDLEEIIFAEELEHQKGILFSNDSPLINNSNKLFAKNWEEISQIILGDWIDLEVENMANSIYGLNKVKTVEKHSGRGNSAIYKLLLMDTNKVALKIYPEISSHDRLKSEFEAVLKVSPEEVQKKMDKALGRNTSLQPTE